MRRFAISCLGVFVSCGAWAVGCDWATDTPPDDAKYKYFVAKSYSETSASDAAAKAERDIDSQLGRMFGTKLNVQSEFYSDTTSADGTTRSYERTIGVITLKGLERQKSDTQKISGGWTGCVQYRYSKAEITKEKERLNSLSDSELNSNPVFTEIAGDSQCKGVPVEIVSVPSGAYVTLDNGKYQGTAPIKFGNVCNGKHSLEITKENYVPVSQQLIVPTTGRISKTLKRDSRRITVRTSLKNSQIEINGINKGKEPVTFNAPLGIEQTITAINSEAVKITRTRTFSKDSDSEYVISMEKLPGKIDFSAFKVRNPGVTIKVNGTTLNSNTTKELSPDRSHNLSFSKRGFYDINKSLSITGGETTYYPSNELRFSKEPIATTGGLVGLGLSMGNDTFGYNVDLGADYKTKYFYGNIGVQLNYIEVGSNISPNLLYYEILYSGFGINVSSRLSVLGLGSLGVLEVGYAGTNKIMPRYGVGVQYLFPFEKDVEWGIRLAYMTGKTPISNSKIAELSRDSNDSLKKITTFNLTFFIRGFNADRGKHE